MLRLSEVAHLDDHERREPQVDVDALGTAGFRPVVRQVFTHTVNYTPKTLIELIKTRSYYLAASQERQAEVVGAVRRLVTTHPELAGRSTFVLPYTTVVLRTALG